MDHGAMVAGFDEVLVDFIFLYRNKNIVNHMVSWFPNLKISEGSTEANLKMKELSKKWLSEKGAEYLQSLQ